MVQLAGQPRSDLDAMQIAWTEADKDFKTAYGEVAFDEIVEKWKGFGVAVAGTGEAAKVGPTLQMGTATTSPTETSSINNGTGAKRKPPCS
jgi:hypothetical protein